MDDDLQLHIAFIETLSHR